MLNRQTNLTRALGLVIAAGFGLPAAAQQDDFADLPTEITLTGTVRDFQERSEEGRAP